jgi:hypothetical protein
MMNQGINARVNIPSNTAEANPQIAIEESDVIQAVHSKPIHRKGL